MDEPKLKYKGFPASKGMRLADLLPLLRSASYSNQDETGTVRLCPECEEWTWIEINLSSGILDLLMDIVVTDIDASDDVVVLWIKTSEFNVPELWKEGE